MKSYSKDLNWIVLDKLKVSKINMENAIINTIKVEFVNVWK